MIQVAIGFCTTAEEVNEKLRLFQSNYPKRKIIGVSISDSGCGWTVCVSYEIEDK